MTPVLAIFPRNQNSCRWLYEALDDIWPVRGASGMSAVDLAMLAIRREPARRLKPHLVPLMPWGRPWRRRLHAPMLRRIAGDAGAVIFTRPDQAPLLPAFARLFKIYHAVDDYSAYSRSWGDQERALLAEADHVIAVSTALGRALGERHPIAPERLTILPNAVAAAGIPARCPDGPAPLPEGITLPRPIAGVVGRLSSRLRLDLLLELADGLPWLNWLFVGDVEREELVPAERPLLERLLRHPRCRFVGRRAFRDLPGFARAFDVAILPYSARSTNPLGSPMRFFLQLPFGTPMLATPGCLQVAEFAPLVRVCATAAAMAGALEALRASNFDDGLRQQRWTAAGRNTWEARAVRLADLLARGTA
jgi:glycosyltransferase involved in cell wall biosynthesis